MGLFDKFAEYFMRQQATRADKGPTPDSEAQGAHADLQRSARALQEEHPGMSRAQARRAIHDSLHAQAAKFIAAIGERQRAVAPAPIAPAPIVQTETTTFAPRPLTMSETTSGASAAGGASNSIPDQEIIINNDGEGFVTITGTVEGGIITLNFVWDTTTCE